VLLLTPLDVTLGFLWRLYRTLYACCKNRCQYLQGTVGTYTRSPAVARIADALPDNIPFGEGVGILIFGPFGRIGMVGDCTVE